MSTVEILVGVLCLLLIGALVTVVVKSENNIDNFKQECIQVKGKPLYNGRNWECLR